MHQAFTKININNHDKRTSIKIENSLRILISALYEIDAENTKELKRVIQQIIDKKINDSECEIYNLKDTITNHILIQSAHEIKRHRPNLFNQK